MEEELKSQIEAVNKLFSYYGSLDRDEQEELIYKGLNILLVNFNHKHREAHKLGELEGRQETLNEIKELAKESIWMSDNVSKKQERVYVIDAEEFDAKFGSDKNVI